MSAPSSPPEIPAPTKFSPRSRSACSAATADGFYAPSTDAT
nr:hypothetical protein [Baekduia soli]